MGTLLTSAYLPANKWTSLRRRYLARPKLKNRFRYVELEGGQELAHRFRGSLSITAQRIWLSELPDGFRGFRILQLSDIHHSLFVPLRQVEAVVELSNRLKPDLVALTGDFVTYSRASIGPVAEILGGLRARCGVIAVLGNHDFRVGAEAVEEALRRQRIQVLRNQHRTLHRGGATLYLAGVDDYGYGADLERALRGIPDRAATVLLAHNPRLVGAAARRSIGLVLSGHTHGGQVNVPLLGTVYGRSPERMRFKQGWDRLGRTQIYVSRGIGTIVLPVRWRCPAEVPLLELEPHKLDGDAIRRDHGRIAFESLPAFHHSLNRRKQTSMGGAPEETRTPNP